MSSIYLYSLTKRSGFMKIGIYGYGNLGRAAEIVAGDFGDTVLAVFTRREPESVHTLGAPVYKRELAPNFADKLDCVLMCGGSFSDLRDDTPDMTKYFNTVDSFDIHAEIEKHRERVDAVAKGYRHSSVISVGWDPGLLSVFRAYFSGVMPRGEINTFWGRGVSQGHSEVIRKIRGVKRAVEYTVPDSDAVMLAHSGKSVDKFARHKRECYVVAEESEHARIESEIKRIPEYYAGYTTEVHFIDEDEFIKKHIYMPHRGECIAFNMSGVYREHISRAEMSIDLDSNPEFTASVMLAYAKACMRLANESAFGVFTALDIPPRYLINTEKAEKII